MCKCAFPFSIFIIILIILYVACNNVSLLQNNNKLGFTTTYEGADLKYVNIDSTPAVRTIDQARSAPPGQSPGQTMMVPDSYSWINRKLPPAVEYEGLEKIIDDRPEYGESLAKKAAYKRDTFPGPNAPSLTSIRHYQVMDPQQQSTAWYYK